MTSRLKGIFVFICLLWMQVSLADDGEDAKVLSMARDAIEKARYAAFVTVDQNGQPRARIVDPFKPDDDFVIYVATRPNTRKVSQIQQNPKVTLLYFDNQEMNTVSVMGTAKIVRDNAIKTSMRRPEDDERFYPDFPDDYLLIKVTPEWLEGLLPGYRGDPDTWAPVSVSLSSSKN